MSETRDIVSTLDGFPAIRLALLFGSVSRGDATESSDLDVAVLAERPLSSQAKSALISALALATGRPIDLIDLARVGEPLLGEILKYGRRILERDVNAYAALISRHLLDAADFLPYRQRILAERRARWFEE